MRVSVAVGLSLAALAFAGDARAADEFGAFLPVGVNVGGSFISGPAEGGFLLGGEVSSAWFHREKMVWFGGYADGLYDFGASAGRFSIGPEFGVGFVGFDAGAVISTLDGIHGGACARLIFTVGFVSAYGRIGHILASPREDTYGEVGLLLKVPIPLESYTPPRPKDPSPSPQPAPIAPDAEPDLAPEPEPEKPSLPVAT